MARPEQRADANTVPAEENDTARHIENRECKLSFEVGEESFAMFLVKMNQNLTVAMGAENVPFCFKIRPALRVLEKLPVADHGHGALFVVRGNNDGNRGTQKGDRLPTYGL